MIDHGSYRTQDFCGPAHVEFTAAGQHFAVKGGVCLVGQEFVSVTIGRRVLGAERAARPTGSPTATASAAPTASSTPAPHATQARIPVFPYSLFALLVGRTPGGTGTAADKAGTYPAGSLVVIVDGQPYPVAQSPVASVTLTSDRRGGTFTGSLLTGGTVAGTFTCGPAA